MESGRFTGAAEVGGVAEPGEDGFAVVEDAEGLEEGFVESGGRFTGGGVTTLGGGVTGFTIMGPEV